jgi:hypothetical protein
MSSNAKRFTIYYAELSLPTSPVLMVISENNSSGPFVHYLRERLENGESNIRVWGRETKELSDADIDKVQQAFELDKTFSVINNRSANELRKDNPIEIDCIFSLIRQVKGSDLWSAFSTFTASTTEVDFWKTHLKDETRPSRYTKGVESFTFNALKMLWKVFGLSGFSSKSKADLFEGFAENAVESASSDASEKFVAQLPKRMIVIADKHRPGPHAIIEDPKQSIAMISRISAGCLFAADQSPDIDEKNIAESYQFIDLKDPYDAAIEFKYDNEMSAMQALNTLYAKRKNE